MSRARLDSTFPVLGAAAGGENAVPIFEGFRQGSLGMRSFQLREGANPQCKHEERTA